MTEDITIKTKKLKQPGKKKNKKRQKVLAIAEIISSSAADSVTEIVSNSTSAIDGIGSKKKKSKSAIDLSDATADELHIAKKQFPETVTISSPEEASGVTEVVSKSTSAIEGNGPKKKKKRKSALNISNKTLTENNATQEPLTETLIKLPPTVNDSAPDSLTEVRDIISKSTESLCSSESNNSKKKKKKKKRQTAVELIDSTETELNEHNTGNIVAENFTETVIMKSASPHQSDTYAVVNISTETKSSNKRKRKRQTAVDVMETADNQTAVDVMETADSQTAVDVMETADSQTAVDVIETANSNTVKEEPYTTPHKETPAVDLFKQRVAADILKQKEENAVDGEDEIPKCPFLGYSDFETFSNTLLPSVVNFLKVTRQLPSTKDEYDFYQSYPSFMSFSKNQGQRVLQLIGQIFKHHHVYQAWNTLPSDMVTGIEEQTEAVIEANDTLLERVDKILDMLKQARECSDKLDIQQKSSKDVLVAAWNANTSSQQNKPIRLLHSKNILRPQLRWKVKPDNSSLPFVQHIKEKPNAKVPLQDEYQVLMKEGTDTGLTLFLKAARGDKTTTYPHPYLYELEHFEPLEWQYQMGLKQEPFEIKDTPLTIIDKPEQLPQLYSKLSSATEIAIDLESHSYRSFLGFTCLMQISTRKEDFIIDTLALRQDLQGLNLIFTDPCILKVLHGATNDIRWLQRDLGLYVVNMFDTFHASKQLGLPRCSLSYLLQRYCDVTADKQYQLADWRIRPLPDVMIKYAREDTHYLLYVYDCLRYELLAKGLHCVETVYRNSCLECQGLFVKPIYTEDSYLDVYNKIKILLKPQQKKCLKVIYAWRDQTARSEDESTAFVLPNHMMFKIAELLPPNQEGILGCCNPPPPLIRLHVQELHLLVEKSRHYNPLLDPRRQAASPDEEYTPDFLDTKHQSAVESIFMPKSSPARRIKERKQIFYIPRTGPDVAIKHSANMEADAVSITSETGSISTSTTSMQFFDTGVLRSELAEAVKAVKESMSAPFKLFMSKIEQLRKEEQEVAIKDAANKVFYPIKDIVPKEETEEEDAQVIIFKPNNKRPPTEDAALKATSKKAKKNVGDFKPFSYEEITMTSMVKNETVKPRECGDMLNKGENSKAKSVRQRTNMKSGNRSGFQSFLKNKFKR